MQPFAHDRRLFLGQAGALALGAATQTTLFRSKEAEARAKKPTLVCLFLRGGADALGTVIPYTNQAYYASRPTIAIPPEAKDGVPGAIKLTEHFGLHPALSAIAPYFEQKKLAAILNVGSPHPTRSHFDAQDFMEYASPGIRTLRDGWLNRYLHVSRSDADTPLRAVALQPLLPRSLRGRFPVLAVPRLTRGNSEGLLDLFDDVYKDTGAMDPEMKARELEGGAEDGRKAAVAVGRHTIETLRHFWDLSEKHPSQAQYPRHGLAQQLEQIARLIRSGEGLEVAALDVHGWDTHQGQGAADGSIARLLRGVAESLKAFCDDLGPLMDKTMVFVMTEFGRNVAENGNRGTDHGRGGAMLALGGPVAGGKVYGDFGSLQPKELIDGRDLPCTIDFRTVFDETLRNLFAFDPPKDFFPIWNRRDPLGLVNKI